MVDTVCCAEAKLAIPCVHDYCQCSSHGNATIAGSIETLIVTCRPLVTRRTLRSGGCGFVHVTDKATLVFGKQVPFLS